MSVTPLAMERWTHTVPSCPPHLWTVVQGWCQNNLPQSSFCNFYLVNRVMAKHGDGVGLRNRSERFIINILWALGNGHSTVWRKSYHWFLSWAIWLDSISFAYTTEVCALVNLFYRMTRSTWSSFSPKIPLYRYHTTEVIWCIFMYTVTCRNYDLGRHKIQQVT